MSIAALAGRRPAQMLLRFRADVLALKPRVVVILAGTNDLAGNAGPVTPDQLMDNLVTMTELARLHGIRVVLASILPVADDKIDSNGQPLLRSRSKPLDLLKTINGRIARLRRRPGRRSVSRLLHARWPRPPARLKPELNDDGSAPEQGGL